MIVFGAVQPAEMTTVDSNDPQASRDSQHLLGIGYAPSCSGCAQLGFVSLGHLDLFMLMFELPHVEYDISIRHM